MRAAQRLRAPRGAPPVLVAGEAHDAQAPDLLHGGQGVGARRIELANFDAVGGRPWVERLSLAERRAQIPQKAQHHIALFDRLVALPDGLVPLGDGSRIGGLSVSVGLVPHGEPPGVLVDAGAVQRRFYWDIFIPVGLLGAVTSGRISPP
jgi:hypothetical protein